SSTCLTSRSLLDALPISERFPWLFGANILVMMAMNRLNIALLNRYHSQVILRAGLILQVACASLLVLGFALQPQVSLWLILPLIDRKSTRHNSSHVKISY